MLEIFVLWLCFVLVTSCVLAVISSIAEWLTPSRSKASGRLGDRQRP